MSPYDTGIGFGLVIAAALLALIWGLARAAGKPAPQPREYEAAAHHDYALWNTTPPRTSGGGDQPYDQTTDTSELERLLRDKDAS